MKLYIDSGSVADVREAVAFGIIDGVTTNPSLIAKEGRDFTQTVREIVGVLRERGDSESGNEFTVSAEVTRLHADEMVAEGRALAAIDPHVVVKVPLTPEGVKAVHRLSREGVRTNMTLCFSTNQALLAAKAGAYMVSPFLGRLDDVGDRGVRLISEMRRVFDHYRFSTLILAASLRHPVHVLDAALAGCDIATMPLRVFKQLFTHPLTEQGNERFMRDWQSFQQQHGGGGQ